MNYTIPDYLKGQKAFYKSPITNGLTPIVIQSVFVTFTYVRLESKKHSFWHPVVQVRSTNGIVYPLDEIINQ